jgi:hypothetical protein
LSGVLDAPCFRTTILIRWQVGIFLTQEISTKQLVMTAMIILTNYRPKKERVLTSLGTLKTWLASTLL